MTEVAIPDDESTFVCYIRPQDFSVSHSTAYIINDDGKRIATMKTKSKGFLIPLSILGGAISSILVGLSIRLNKAEVREKVKANLIHVSEQSEKFKNWVKHAILKLSPLLGATIGIGAPMAIAGLRKPEFSLYDSNDAVIMFAKYQRISSSWVIQHKTPEWSTAPPDFIYILKPDQKAQTFDLWVKKNEMDPDENQEGDSGAEDVPGSVKSLPDAPVVRIPMVFGTGLEFGAGKSFRARVEKLNRFRFDLGSTGYKIALPLIGSQESYELSFKGSSQVPRDVLAFCTYMVRTVNILPFDLLLYMATGVGAAGLLTLAFKKTVLRKKMCTMCNVMCELRFCPECSNETSYV